MTPADEDKLLQLYRALDAESRKGLLDYAAFLSGRVASAGPVPKPDDIPRPEEETVVAAIRRLSETYFMLDKEVMLHKAAGMMAEHVLQGRDAAAVIDDLEAAFSTAYDKLLPKDSAAD